MSRKFDGGVFDDLVRDDNSILVLRARLAVRVGLLACDGVEFVLGVRLVDWPINGVVSCPRSFEALPASFYHQTFESALHELRTLPRVRNLRKVK